MTELKRSPEGSPIARAETQTPRGKPMSLADLPPPETERWVARRKAEVVAGVREGVISLEEACRRYRLSVDEYRSWERLYARHGLEGLRTTRIKKFRRGH